jgi:hypothetical protein
LNARPSFSGVQTRKVRAFSFCLNCQSRFTNLFQCYNVFVSEPALMPICHFSNYFKTEIMKIKKTLLKAIALAVVVSAANTSCTKEEITPGEEEKKEKKEAFNCVFCGMG